LLCGEFLLAAVPEVVHFAPGSSAATITTVGATVTARFLAAAIATALAVPGLAPAATRNNTLIATDGPGFTITMSKKTVKAGTYVITIHDRSAIHDFHLTGPGVNKTTSVPAIGTTKWKVKLKKGTYHFVCDPHRAIMHGILKVT